ncbi:unnamed protein product, partial [Oncorhynchus mykiss]
ITDLLTGRGRCHNEHILYLFPPQVKTVELPGGVLEDHFDTSVRMSTYLVAFIVSDFQSVSKTTSHGVKISVYAVPDKINQTDFALNAAVRLLDFYDDYFDIPYPLPKQDLAAIPDFQSGAMENWGLTTYREAGLLFDPNKSSASDKLGITMVIAHELAHQVSGTNLCWFINQMLCQNIQYLQTVFHILLCYNLNLKLTKYFFFWPIYTQHPKKDKVKTSF